METISYFGFTCRRELADTPERVEAWISRVLGSYPPVGYDTRVQRMAQADGTVRAVITHATSCE